MVENHIVNGWQSWCTLEWLDPTFSHLAKKDSNKYSFKTNTPLDSDGNLAKIGITRVIYQFESPIYDEKMFEFDDVFLFVEHLLFVEQLKDPYLIRQVVISCRVEKHVYDMPSLTRSNCQLLETTPKILKYPDGFEENDRQDIEQTMLEMSNYATLCVTDNHAYIDEKDNLDMKDILPYKSSLDQIFRKKKKSRSSHPPKEKYIPITSEMIKSGYPSKNKKKQEKPKSEPKRESIARQSRSRSLMPAVLASKNQYKQNFSLEKPVFKKPKESRESLVKRKPEPPTNPKTPEPLKQMEISRMVNTKPTYKSRNSSPPRASRTIHVDRRQSTARHSLSIDQAAGRQTSGGGAGRLTATMRDDRYRGFTRADVQMRLMEVTGIDK